LNFLSSVEVYNPEVDKWEFVASMNTKRSSIDVISNVNDQQQKQQQQQQNSKFSNISQLISNSNQPPVLQNNHYALMEEEEDENQYRKTIKPNFQQ